MDLWTNMSLLSLSYTALNKLFLGHSDSIHDLHLWKTETRCFEAPETNHNTVSQAQLFTVSHMTYMLWWSACLLITFPCRWVEQNLSSTGVSPQLNSTLPQTFSGFSFTQIFALCHSTCPDTHMSSLPMIVTSQLGFSLSFLNLIPR